MDVSTEKNLSSTTNTTETINSFYFYEVEQFAVLWILLVIIVAGNCGVLITLLYKGSRKSRMNYFITHLAFADLSVGLITVLTDLIWRMTVSWNAGNVACKLIKYLQVVVTYASTYVLVALSIDRYDAIRHPMKFSGSWKRARCLISTAWLFSVFLAIPILVFYEEKTVQDKIQCWIEFQEVWQWRLYMSLVAASLFVIPAAIIASCYVVIIITIWSKSATTFTKYKAKKHSGSIGSENSKRASSRGLIPKAKVKTVKITFVIVTVFILCWSPYIIFDLLQVFGYVPETQTNVAIATLVQSLAPLNSAANPIIYCIFSTHFCRTLCGFPPFIWFKRKKGKRKGDSNDTNTKSSSLSEYLTNNTHSHKSRFAQQSTTEIHAVSIHLRD